MEGLPAKRTIEGEGVAAESMGRFLRERQKALYPLIFILIFWHLLTYFFPPYLIPSILTVGGELVSICTDWSLLTSFFTTIYRVLVALLVSFCVGTSLTVLVSFHAPSRDFCLTLFHFAMGVPSLSWVVIAVIWFSSVELRIFCIVAITSLPMFALQIDDGIRAISSELIEMMKLFRPNRWQLLRKLILPAILPSIFTSWKINLGYGTRVVIVAELVGATVGVGNQLLMAQELFRMEAAIAWTLMLVFFLLVTEELVILIENYVLRYRPGRALA